MNKNWIKNVNKKIMIEIIIAVIVFIVGLILITISSNIAIKHSTILAASLGISPLIIGITLVSIGTDLSEIINSIMSCALGHGDIDVGDSVGSDLTQITLVFGLLPLIAGSFKVERKEVIILGMCEIMSLIVIFSVVEKGYITRLNAIFMVGSLFIYFFIISSVTKDTFIDQVDIEIIMEGSKSKKYHVLFAALSFVGVTIASYFIVTSIITISSLLNVHEYIISFFFVSIGTSLPELAVDLNAIRKKQYKMALGDIIGSCIVDSTLSIGIGQVLFPQVVTAELAIPTILYTLFATFVVISVLATRKKIDRKTGILFIALYLGSYFLLFFLI